MIQLLLLLLLLQQQGGSTFFNDINDAVFFLIINTRLMGGGGGTPNSTKTFDGSAQWRGPAAVPCRGAIWLDRTNPGSLIDNE